MATSKTIEERGRGIARLIIAKPFEVPAVISGFLLFFLLFASYFVGLGLGSDQAKSP